jgi:3-dehydroquinate dehydratase
LYTNQQLWEAKQQQGFVIYNHRFDKTRFIPVLMNKINELKQDLLSHRQANFIGVMLSHHQFASTKYMAKWIEEKSK